MIFERQRTANPKACFYLNVPLFLDSSTTHSFPTYSIGPSSFFFLSLFSILISYIFSASNIPAKRRNTKMRLLGWMHNKLQQTSIDPFKDFTIGNYCACLSAKSSLDDEHFNEGPRFNSIYDGQKTSYEDEASAMAMSEIYHGFLAIGTLGSEPVNNEPATPTFPINIEDDKGEVTENDLKLINSELEKFFEAEAEEESDELARSSYVSAITLSGAQMEQVSFEDSGKPALFPLQGYLFGSTIQLPETPHELDKEKALQGEVIHSTKSIDEVSDVKEEMQTKQAQTSAKKFIKKILKKFYTSSRNSVPGDDTANSVSAKKQLNKIRRMFHRKVHPESSTYEKEFTKSQGDIKKATDHQANLERQDEYRKEFPPGPNLMEEMQSNWSNLKQSHDDMNCISSGGNKEHWIKTDAEYLVLEL